MPTVTDGDGSSGDGANNSNTDNNLSNDTEMNNLDDSSGDNSSVFEDSSSLNNSNNGRGTVAGAPPPTQINKMKYANPVNMIKRERRQSSSR